MKRWFGLLLIILLGYGANGWAGDVKMRGFASFVGGFTGGGDELYDGYDNHVNFAPDSLVALQFDADLENNLRATVQLTGYGLSGYDPQLEWAYVTYEYNDSVQLSAGKIRIPFYRYSDFLGVRYTQNWIEGPKEVYGFDFSNFDGVSLLHTTDFAGWDSSLQVVFGQYDGKIGETVANIEDLTGVAWAMNRDWLLLRASYFQSNVTIEIDQFTPLVGAVNSVGSALTTNLSNVTSGILVDGDTGTFFGLAMGIDHSNVLLDAEFIEYEIKESMIPKTRGHYVTLGYRAGQFTPYVTKSTQTADPKDKLSGLVPAAIASIPVIPTAFGNITLPQMLSGAVAGSKIETDVVEFGLRYDFHPSAALKASYMQREDIAGDKISLMRVGIDLVF